MKALPITVYYNRQYRGCANGGITERFEELLLICPEGFIDIDENNPPENLVKLVKRHLFGEDYYHIEPYVRPNKGCVGWMAGGSYAATSDSRFSRMMNISARYGAISVHDRQETQSDYDMLSH